MKKKFSLRTILIVFLFFTVLVTSSIQNMYLFTYFKSNLTVSIQEAYEQVVSLKAEILNNYFNSIKSLTFSIRNNSIYQQSLKDDSKSTFLECYRTMKSVTTLLRSLSYSYDNIAGILLLSDNRSIYEENISFGYYNQNLLKGTEFLDIITSSVEQSGFLPTIDNFFLSDTYFENFFCYYSKIYKNNKLYNTICILINSEAFAPMLEADNNNNILFTLSKDDNIIYPYTSTKDNFPLTTENEITNNYISVTHKLNNDWTLSAFISDERLKNSIKNLSNYLFASFIILFIINSICIIIIATIISKSLNRIGKKMELVGVINCKFTHNSRIREIAQLNLKYNEMNNRILELLDDVKMKQAAISKSKLDLLNAQINPHFLYNTLDAINWMALGINAENISYMVSKLAATFRIGLNNGWDLITVYNELLHIRNYLDIQKYRYDNRFSVSYEIDEILNEEQCLHMILQPFVENCLLHGFYPDKRHLHIRIKVFSDNTNLIFHILDDGIGCDCNKLNDYLYSEQAPEEGYGVKNVNQRLMLYYNINYGVRYLTCNKGTCVEIKLPFTKNRNI